MVRGTSRRVIVVDSPDTELFEQAIFIVRSDVSTRSGVTAQKLVDIDMYEKQFSRWDLMELTSEDSWLEELKKYKDGTLFSRDALLDKLTIGEMNSHYLQVAVTAYDPIADVGPDRWVFWMDYESRQPLEAYRADLISIVGQTG